MILWAQQVVSFWGQQNKIQWINVFKNVINLR